MLNPVVVVVEESAELMMMMMNTFVEVQKLHEHVLRHEMGNLEFVVVVVVVVEDEFHFRSSSSLVLSFLFGKKTVGDYDDVDDEEVVLCSFLFCFGIMNEINC